MRTGSRPVRSGSSPPFCFLFFLLVCLAPASPAAGDASVPSVTLIQPGNGATAVPRDAFVSASVFAPRGGIDPSTLTDRSVLLRRDSDSTVVPAVLHGSDGGDLIVLRPVSVLDAVTAYTFAVTSELRDSAGAAFAPASASFTTGVASGGAGSVAYTKVGLTTPAGTALTCVTIGPDGKLYGAVNDGEILRLPILLDGTAGPAQSITSLRDAEGGDRLLIGLRFDPAATAGDLVLWASHSFFAFSGAPDWTGKVSRLNGADLGTVTDVVVNLPRSTRDHVTNQLDFGPDGALYFLQGSNTAMGAPDNAWNLRPERRLSAAVLRLDTAAVVPPLDVKTEEGGAYDPFAPGAPLTLFASGVRNAFDLVWHSNGSLYVPTNGSAAGGATPASPSPVFCDDRIDQEIYGDYTGPVVPGIPTVNQTENDWLFRVEPRGYYGHPNPVRCEWVMNGGNPTSGPDVAQIDQYPVGTQPDRNWRGAAFDFGQHRSPDGILESRSAAFGGALLGRLLVARFSSGDDVMILSPGVGGAIIGSQTGVAGLGGFNNPLDLVEDASTGNLYVAEYGDQATTVGAKLTLLRPIPAPCMGTPPPEPPGLWLSRTASGAARLAWPAVATATSYDVVAGSLGVLRSSAGDFGAAVDRCLGNQLVATQREDPSTPGPGAGFWYLVRATNCSSAGSYDSGGPAQQGSRDAEVDAAATTCP